MECPTYNAEHHQWLVLARPFEYCRNGDTIISVSRLHTAADLPSLLPPLNRRIHILHPAEHQHDLNIVREALAAFISGPGSQGKVHMQQDLLRVSLRYGLNNCR